MNFKKKHIILWLFAIILCCVSFGKVWKNSNSVVVSLLTTQKEFVAGEDITLRFDIKPSVEIGLLLNSSYGQTMVTSEDQEFKIPDFITEKKGNVHYTLFSGSQTLFEGDLYIEANPKTKIQLESYIGPPSIIAGGKDYTMHVVVPTDIYDNPLPDSTQVSLRHQFLASEKEKEVFSSDMIGWSNIYSYNLDGRLLISSQVGGTSSKEFSVDVFPDLPLDFEIKSNSKHVYADGNQIIEFETSILQDEYGNTSSDGTLVQFLIKNSTGTLLQTQGNTFRGKAIGKILHPDREESWKVTAYVPGIAKSNTLEINFKPVLQDFKIQYSSDKREITIGPLLSFMDQLIPDGARVTLHIKQNNGLEETLIKTTSDGKVKFILKPEFYPPNTYEIKITTLGVTKTLKAVYLK